jgi:hypothetical protein
MMATIRSLTEKPITVRKKHTDVDATYAIVEGEAGEKCLQIDTYGSDARAMPDKKSQSIRFGPAAAQELQRILAKHFR